LLEVRVLTFFTMKTQHSERKAKPVSPNIAPSEAVNVVGRQANRGAWKLKGLWERVNVFEATRDGFSHIGIV
jgi:hypothetical protein